MSFALNETLAFYLFFGMLALAQVPAAFLLAAPETDPVIRGTAFRFGTPALFSILIEIDCRHRLPPQIPDRHPHSSPAECNRPRSPNKTISG